MPAGVQNAQCPEPVSMARYVNDEVVMGDDFQGPLDATGPPEVNSLG
jgi:hypothetical protein